jgi:hypothetical protein
MTVLVGLLVLLAAPPCDATMAIDAPDELQPDAPASVLVRLRDPGGCVARVQLRFRREASLAWNTIEVAPDDVLSIVIPALALAPEPRSYRLEVSVDALDSAAETVARQTLPLDVAAAEPTSGGVEGVGVALYLCLAGVALTSGLVAASAQPNDGAELTFAISGSILLLSTTAYLLRMLL